MYTYSFQYEAVTKKNNGYNSLEDFKYILKHHEFTRKHSPSPLQIRVYRNKIQVTGYH